MQAWDAITRTIAAEFSDLSDLEQLTRLVVRLLLAALLGGLMGLQREHSGKEAGIRTHMLVALGSAMFVMVPLQAGADADGLSRVVQGLVAGIGFLCAGAILKRGEEDQVRGLTTAAGIWMTAAIGVAIGMGRLGTAAIGAAFAWFVLAAMIKVDHMVDGSDDKA
jgi:putative Mg2+ transporter-C (MgtC) family protein